MNTPHADSAVAKLALDSRDYNLALANVVLHAGDPAFYQTLAALLARVMGLH